MFLKRQILRAALLAGNALAFSSLRSAAQDPIERARRLAQQALQTTQDEHPLPIFRREDLEQTLQAVHAYPNIKSKEDLVIFEVRDQGYYFTNNSMHYFITVDGGGIRFLAVMPSSGEVFRIAGFRDAQQEFNRFVKAYEVKLSTELQAEDYARLYLQIDPANNKLNETPSLLMLKQLAERKFAYRDGDFLLQGQTDPASADKYKKYLAGEARFDKWWAKNRDALARLKIAEETRKTDTGFDTDLMTLSDLSKRNPDVGPAPLKVTLHFSSNGLASEPTFRPVTLPTEANEGGIR